MRQPDRTVGVLGIFVLLVFIGLVTYFMFFSDSNIKINWIFNPKNQEQKSFEKIKLASELSDNSRIMNLIEEFLIDYPDSPYRNKVLSVAAESLYQRKDYEKAKKYIEKVVTSVNSKSEEYVNAVIILGKIGLEQDQFDPVTVRYLEDAFLAANSAQKNEIAVFLGFHYLFKKSYESALLYFNQSISEYAYAGRARVYIEEGKYPEAIQEYINYFSAYPKGAIEEGMKKAFLKQTLFYSGQLAQARLPQKAMDYLYKITDLFPKEKEANEAYYQVSLILQSRKDYAGALTVLNKSLRLNPSDNAISLYQKGVIYYQMNKKKESLETFKDFQSEYPNSPDLPKVKDWIELVQKDLQF